MAIPIMQSQWVPKLNLPPAPTSNTTTIPPATPPNVPSGGGPNCGPCSGSKNFNNNNNTGNCNTTPPPPVNQLPPPLPLNPLPIPLMIAQGGNNPNTQNLKIPGPQTGQVGRGGSLVIPGPQPSGGGGFPTSGIIPNYPQFPTNPLPNYPDLWRKQPANKKPCPQTTNTLKIHPTHYTFHYPSPCPPWYDYNYDPCGGQSSNKHPCKQQGWNNKSVVQNTMRTFQNTNVQPAMQPLSNTVSGNQDQPILQSGKQSSATTPNNQYPCTQQGSFNPYQNYAPNKQPRPSTGNTLTIPQQVGGNF